MYNESSPHTLLSEYEMRESGLIVDPVSKHHKKDDKGNFGTQSIKFLDGTTVDLKSRAALMTFRCALSTMEEYNTLPVYDIAVENWCPSEHYDDERITLHGQHNSNIYSIKSEPMLDSGETLIEHSGEDINKKSDSPTASQNDLEDEDQFYDAIENIKEDDKLYYFDAMDELEPSKPGKVMHLTIDYQTIAQGEKGRDVFF